MSPDKTFYLGSRWFRRYSRAGMPDTVDYSPESSYTDVAFDEEGRIVDFLSDSRLIDRPEERVRQHYLRVLHYQYGYPKDLMAREVPIYHGRQQLRDSNDDPVFADIAVYTSAEATQSRDQGAIDIVVEVKAPDEPSGHNQLVSYVFNTSANGAVWHNGDDTSWFRRFSVPDQRLVLWPGIPHHGEAWDAVGRREKDALLPLVDVRRTFARCHNKLHKRGAEGEDLTMDMVRILLAKARDEEREGPYTTFYCTPDEYTTEAGRTAVASRVQTLFAEVRDANPTVFESSERIRVGDRQIAEVVVELQDYRLIGDDDQQWDVMGAAYEQYTADLMKREGGQYFTNRLVVNLLTEMIAPQPDHLVLDPAGGTGGFATASIRYMRRVVRNSHATDAVKRRRREQIKDRIFLIDISHRLVKIAKAAMILTGNGHRGFARGDSLAPFDTLPSDLLARVRPGQVDRVLTNPPFAGTTDGKIDAPAEMMPQFRLAARWERDRDRNQYVPTADHQPGGVPPELLFIERCVQWVRPGGLIGIVVPKGVLENPEITLAARHFMFRNTYVRAVIACHKNTFQPFTGTRTALLVLEKKPEPSPHEMDSPYPIFMAISRKVGQDSEGAPIFKKDAEGGETTDIDHDLDEIFEAWIEHQGERLEASEYTFSIDSSEIDSLSLNISPQKYRPSLNEAIGRVLELGESDVFEVLPLGDIAEAIWKGSRFRREDLEVEDPSSGTDVVRYYTPGALLQDRPESIKYLDLGLATPQRRANIRSHALDRLELLVTRSGSVGRVILTTVHHEGHIGSDDLIHIEIPDEDLRLYIYSFLKSDLGQKQMQKNEYGTVQQHLEPAHLREVLIPLPTDDTIAKQIASSVRRSIEAKESSLIDEDEALNFLSTVLDQPTD